MTRSVDAMAEEAVRARYKKAANTMEPALCCPVNYDPRFLEAIPEAVLERDYGCGDPSKYLKEGDTVLDLGSGGGKICFIASQVVGAEGTVIGVDMNNDMLALAHEAAPKVAGTIGWDNVTFHKGRIQDLAVDMDKVEAWLADHPVTNAEDLGAVEAYMAELRSQEPMIADNSIDVVVSNCVLNLVRPADKAQLFREIHRVLKPGGRAVISDIVCDEEVPQSLQEDPKLWSGCISGAFREDQFLQAFAQAGLYGIRILEYGTDPWQVVDGIEFRTVTVEAFKGKEGPCWERNQAVMYMGPWKRVEDDDGHVLERGIRMAVCDKTYQIMTRAPYRDQIVGITPQHLIDLDDAQPFACSVESRVRDPKETKGGVMSLGEGFEKGGACAPGGECC